MGFFSSNMGIFGFDRNSITSFTRSSWLKFLLWTFEYNSTTLLKSEKRKAPATFFFSGTGSYKRGFTLAFFLLLFSIFYSFLTLVYISRLLLEKKTNRNTNSALRFKPSKDVGNPSHGKQKTTRKS